MGRILGDLSAGDLDDAPEVHDGDPVGDVPRGGEIVGDEEDRHPELLRGGRSIRLSTVAASETSSELVGSSQSRTGGMTIARAIATRCRLATGQLDRPSRRDDRRQSYRSRAWTTRAPTLLRGLLPPRALTDLVVDGEPWRE